MKGKAKGKLKAQSIKSSIELHGQENGSFKSAIRPEASGSKGPGFTECLLCYVLVLGLLQAGFDVSRGFFEDGIDHAAPHVRPVKGAQAGG